MACKMLFFDYRESEEEFFRGNRLDCYDIKFFKESLNDITVCNLTEEDFEETMIISVFSTSAIDDEIVSKFKNLRVISTRSTGHDHIDIGCCIRKNIALINVDSYGTKAVAQYVLGLIIQLVRKICISCKFENNPLIPKNFCGHDLDKLTLGIIGTGTVGTTLCKYAYCLDMKIFAYDTAPNRNLVDVFGVEYVDKEDLLRLSDIVVILIPYTHENYHSFSYGEFKIMKQGSYFINVSRGEFVDNEALLETAKTGKFRGIGLDVVACNSKNKESDITSKDCIETGETVKELAKLPNVIITPQIAYDTQEAVNYILKTTFEALGDFLQGGRSHRIV